MPLTPTDGGVPSIDVREANKRMAAPDAGALLLDVREEWEYTPRRAAGAVNIPMSQLQRRASEIPPDREILVICEHGSRSATVVRFLRRKGVERAVNIAGGTDAWERQGLPMAYGLP